MNDPFLSDRAALVTYRLDDAPHTLRPAQPGRVASRELQADWHWQPAGEAVRTWVELTNLSEQPIYLETVDFLLAGPPARAVYQNGWQSWSPTFARHLDGSLYADPGTDAYRIAHQPHGDGAVMSEWVMVVAGETGGSAERNLLVGFVTAAHQLAEVRLAPDGTRLTARCHFDGALLPPGASVASETLLLQAGADPLALLETWAAAIGQEMSARIPAQVPTGWCTWYYFYGENTAQEVLENVEAIAQHGLPLDVILLDDGFQTAIGDWLSINTDKFPEGMEAVARAIRQAGHTLGLWSAPFGAAAHSHLFAQHPDWLLRDETGAPVLGWTHWGTDCYALDCTHPAVLAWLRETFRFMRQEWGVELFKIDFLFAAARPGRRHDPSATRAQALRRGVEAIRQAIGDDAFLLGCGAPLGPCVGLVDGMRVGPDVDPNWHPIWRNDLSAPSAESALRNSLTRAPFHNRLWANDPDCLLVRQRGADLDLVLNEMRTLTALTALLGGLTINSDHLPLIRPGRLKYLRQALPPTGVSARPLDLFENELPRLLLLSVERDWGRWWVAGLVNWDERTVETTVHLRDLGLPPGRYHVYHYWRRRYLGVTADAVTIRRHQPHETAVLLFRPVSDYPTLLTTTFHVCQGAVEVESVSRIEAQPPNSEFGLRIVLSKAGRQEGDVLFSVPDGWRASSATVDGARRELRTVAPRVVALGLTLAGRAQIELTFERQAQLET